jgi:hypothetical protein
VNKLEIQRLIALAFNGNSQTLVQILFYSFQVQSGFIQARDMSCDTYGIVSTKSVQIYGQGVVMVKEGYAMLPPKVLEFTDPALEATVKYSTVAYDKSKEMYNQAAIVILEQYKIHSPTVSTF